MPEKQEHRTKPRSRVRIKDTVTQMYPNARVFNEAVVGKQMHDHLGYPLIYVEWDKEHWSYCGESDGWVLEAHFDLVEDKMAEEKPDFKQALAALLKQYEDEGSPQDHAASVEEPDPRPTAEPTYDDVLDKSIEDARRGEAFVTIVATPETYQGIEIIVPHIYLDSKREDAAMVLDAALADYLAQTVTRLISERVRELREHDGPFGA